jgi:hypothetical protein
MPRKPMRPGHAFVVRRNCPHPYFALIYAVVISSQWDPPRRLFLVTLSWALEEDMETPGQHDLTFIGDEVPKDDELHRQYFKRQTVNAINQAMHRKKKDVDDLRLSVEGLLLWGTNIHLACQSQCGDVSSHGMQMLPREADRETNKTRQFISSL